MKLPKLLNDARQLAKQQWHSELTPLHLASVLITFQGGLFSQAISTVGGDGAILSVENQLKEALKQHAAISLPPPQHIGPSPSFVHLRKCAQRFQETRGDTEFGVEQSGLDPGKLMEEVIRV